MFWGWAVNNVPKGWINECGYRRTRIGKRQVYAHRLKYESRFGLLFPKFHVHHVDGDKTNNALKNLAPIWIGTHTAMHNRERKRCASKTPTL